jgi:hypothetical protein
MGLWVAEEPKGFMGLLVYGFMVCRRTEGVYGFMSLWVCRRTEGVYGFIGLWVYGLAKNRRGLWVYGFMVWRRTEGVYGFLFKGSIFRRSGDTPIIKLPHYHIIKLPRLEIAAAHTGFRLGATGMRIRFLPKYLPRNDGVFKGSFHRSGDTPIIKLPHYHIIKLPRLGIAAAHTGFRLGATGMRIRFLPKYLSLAMTVYLRAVFIVPEIPHYQITTLPHYQITSARDCRGSYLLSFRRDC